MNIKLRLMVNGVEGDPAPELKSKMEEVVEEINKKIISRATRVSNALRNSALDVLKGSRSGRVYKKPRSSSMYTASAPGEPPAARTGALRQNWNSIVATESGSGGVHVKAGIISGQSYAGYLEHGTSRMAPRPYVERILEKARPEIEKILDDI